MSKVNIDTTKYNELVGSFNTCIQTYNDSVNTFFDSIVNNNGWKGEAADTYIEKTNVEKVKYTNFGESLVKFVDTLYMIGTSIDSGAASERN